MSLGEFVKNLALTNVLRSAKDSSGNTTGIVGADGRRLGALIPPPVKRARPFLDVTDASVWTDVVGCTVAVDNTVLFNGQPTLKLTVPAGTSLFRVGTSAMTAQVPSGWDRKNVGIAIKTTNPALVQGWDFKLGDAGFANYYQTSCTMSHYGTVAANPAGTVWVQANEWWCGKAPSTLVTDQMAPNGSSPALATQMRARLTFGSTSSPAPSAQTEYVWIGFAGVLPDRKKPTIILEGDDGFKAHGSFVADLALFYDMPVSFAVNASSLGTGNYMTQSRVKALADHPSRLFDITNHGSVHTKYDPVTFAGAAACANAIAGRDGLRAIGITGDGPLHFVTPDSLWGNDLIPLLKQNGFLSCRNAGYSRVEDGKDQFLWMQEDKWQFNLNVCTQLRGVGAGTAQRSLAQVQAEIQQVITDGGVGIINYHDLQDTSGNYVWLRDDFATLIKWLADLRDAGTIENKSKTRWFADATGRICDLR